MVVSFGTSNAMQIHLYSKRYPIKDDHMVNRLHLVTNSMDYTSVTLTFRASLSIDLIRTS